MDHSRAIQPVILCGGSGTRLWPLSRPDRPKPFLPLLGETSLFERTLARVAPARGYAPPVIVAGADHVALVEGQVARAEHTLIVEPVGRNTAPAIALAAARADRDTILLVCPSDHHIGDEKAFGRAVESAATLARDGRLVALAIAPDRAEIGYGYIRRGEALGAGYAVAEFVEKPDRARAEAYLASGEFSWNGGIFVFRTGDFLDALAEHRPAMAERVERAVAGGSAEGSRFHPDEDAFAAITGESIDYAVMENTDRAAMVPVAMEWSDIGNWAALKAALASQADSDGNVVRGAVDLSDCRNVLAMSDGPRISAVGLADACIVASGDDILVTSDAGAPEVGRLSGASRT